MKIEYSYGLLGYAMKYVGGVVILALSILFMALPILALVTKSIEEMLDKPILFGVFLMFGFGILFLRASYYCFKYANLFTMRFAFDENKVGVVKGNASTTNIPTKEIKKIVYMRLIQIFEIHLTDSKMDKIIIMNNGQRETNSYLALKEWLLKQNNVTLKWW